MRVGLAGAVGVVLGLFATSCSSESESNAAPSQPPALVGQFGPTEPGPVIGVEFTSDGRYHLLLTDCDGRGDACTERGTFSLDGAGSELSLTDDATGRRRVLPFRVTGTEPQPSDLRPLDFVGQATLVSQERGLISRIMSFDMPRFYGGRPNGFIVCSDATNSIVTTGPPDPPPPESLRPNCYWTKTPSQ